MWDSSQLSIILCTLNSHSFIAFKQDSIVLSHLGFQQLKQDYSDFHNIAICVYCK